MENESVWAAETLKKVISKMEWVSEKSKDKIPYTTIDGIHDDRADQKLTWNMDDGINWWCNGFFGGMLWMMYHETKDQKYMDIARISVEKLDLAFEMFYGLHHDVGFMWLPTAVADYRLTKNPVSRKRGLHAANLLAGRFNLAGKFIRAWNDNPDNDTSGWAIIDCLLNLPLLYWASEETKDPRYKQIAMAHADTAMEHFIRPDGSSFHIIEFDPETGIMNKAYGGQGFDQNSSWSRGQAWALYGFVLSYIHTGKIEYLNTAKRCANYFISNIPDSGIIPVDFRSPKEPRFEDSTAAAIASCGLIELAKIVDPYEKNMYLSPAVKLLKTLDHSRCDYTEECDCFLQNCSSAYHVKKHHISIIYGDFFYMEALLKLKGDDLCLW